MQIQKLNSSAHVKKTKTGEKVLPQDGREVRGISIYTASENRGGGAHGDSGHVKVEVGGSNFAQGPKDLQHVRQPQKGTRKIRKVVIKKKQGWHQRGGKKAIKKIKVLGFQEALQCQAEKKNLDRTVESARGGIQA